MWLAEPRDLSAYTCDLPIQLVAMTPAGNRRKGNPMFPAMTECQENKIQNGEPRSHKHNVCNVYRVMNGESQPLAGGRSGVLDFH